MRDCGNVPEPEDASGLDQRTRHLLRLGMDADTQQGGELQDVQRTTQRHELAFVRSECAWIRDAWRLLRGAGARTDQARQQDDRGPRGSRRTGAVGEANPQQPPPASRTLHTKQIVPASAPTTATARTASNQATSVHRSVRRAPVRQSVTIRASTTLPSGPNRATNHSESMLK